MKQERLNQNRLNQNQLTGRNGAAQGNFARDPARRPPPYVNNRGPLIVTNGNRAGNGTTYYRPQAAQQRGQFRPGNQTRRFSVGQNDVFRSNQNLYRNPNHNKSGLTDFEKFGLIALGAVVVGSLLNNGNRVISNSGDRVIVQDPQGYYNVYHDDDAIIRRPGSNITSETYDDGSVLTRIEQPDGSVITTVRDVDGRVLRRSVQYPGRPDVVLFDDTQAAPPPPVVDQLPPRSPVDILYSTDTGEDLLATAFNTRPIQPIGRTFSLDQVRQVPEVRYLAPDAEITTLNFDSGSSAISDQQAQTLATLGRVMTNMISQNPQTVFLIEGHSDTAEDPVTGLALSDARAQSTALALTEYFGVPPQNLITQGYGETDLREQVDGPDEVNRRIIVRNITGLLN